MEEFAPVIGNLSGGMFGPYVYERVSEPIGQTCHAIVFRHEVSRGAATT